MDRLGLSGPTRPQVHALGLTGGIGSGKSTVAQQLVARGAFLVDTDAIARALTQAGGSAMPALAAAFGPEALAADGSLNRDHMRRLAFGDPGAKLRLEAVLHPLIGQEAQRQAEAAADRPVVYDVPLLTESDHWRARVHRVLVVDCRESTQVERVARRPGWDAAAAQRVVALQATRAARRAIADAVIFNDGIDLEALDSEVGALWQQWFGAG
ncbi:MAG: dephospho-CoA kinase [Rubrivivax sp.]|nr:dephospho-CoA kinase [Rubrivivax sp.]